MCVMQISFSKTGCSENQRCDVLEVCEVNSFNPSNLVMQMWSLAAYQADQTIRLLLYQWITYQICIWQLIFYKNIFVLETSVFREHQ